MTQPFIVGDMFSDARKPVIEPFLREPEEWTASPEVRRLFQQFAAVQHLEHRPSGSLLHSEGEFPKALFMLVSGQIKLSMYSRTGSSCRLRVVSAGDLIGLSAAISGRPYDATAETLEPSTIAYIRRDDFLGILHESNESCFSVLQLLSRDISSCYDLMRNFCGDRAKCS